MTIVGVILLLILIGMLPIWPYSNGWSWGYPGTLGTFLLIIAILYFTGHLLANHPHF